MTRKAAAKRSEANAAVRRRSAGLDQRFKMSASVAGFPSINAATACLGFLYRSRRRCEHSVLHCLHPGCYKPYRCFRSHCFASMSRELYLSTSLRFLHCRLSRFNLERELALAACKTLEVQARAAQKPRLRSVKYNTSCNCIDKTSRRER